MRRTMYAKSLCAYAVMYDPEKMRELRKGDSYEKYCYYILPALVEKVHEDLLLWKTNSKLDHFFTVSDEAFGLAVVENYYDRWMSQSGNEGDGKYTGGAGIRGNAVRGYGGWTTRGRQEFYKLCELVKKDREENGKAFDEHYGKALFRMSNGAMGIDENGRSVCERTMQEEQDRRNNILTEAVGNGADKPLEFYMDEW